MHFQVYGSNISRLIARIKHPKHFFNYLLPSFTHLPSMFFKGFKWFYFPYQGVMSGLELLSAEGLRLDGRKPLELKQIVCKVGIFSEADGSASIEHGNTKAICSVYGPHECINRAKSAHDKAVVNCEYSMATFSTNYRRNRPTGDRRSTELTIALEKVFEAAIMTSIYPRSQIDIFVQV